MGTGERHQQLDLVVGRVLTVEEHPGARAPSYLLALDLGPRGRRETTLAGDYSPGELRGRQVVCAVAGDEVLLLAAHSHARGLVLLRPDREVEEGSPVA